jgi:hypothetical protein
MNDASPIETYDPKNPAWGLFRVRDHKFLNPESSAAGLHWISFEVPTDYPSIEYATICAWSRARARNETSSESSDGTESANEAASGEGTASPGTGRRVTYWPGSILNVQPVLGEELVEDILDVIGQSGEKEVEVTGATLSLREAIATRFDNSGVAKATVIKALSELAPHSLVLANWNASPKDERETFGTTYDVMKAVFDESGVRLPLPALLKACARPITCRRYTIASHVLRCDTLDLLVVEANTRLRNGRLDRGICSSMLAACKPGDFVRAQVMVKPDYPPTEATTETLFLFGRGSGYSGLPHFAWDTLAHGGNRRIVLATGGTTISEVANLPELEALAQAGVQVVVGLRSPESAQDYLADHPKSGITFVGKDIAETMNVPGVCETLLEAMRSGEARICGGPGPTGALTDWLIANGHLELYPEAQAMYDKFKAEGPHKGDKAKALRRHCMRAMEVGGAYRGKVFVDVF